MNNWKSILSILLALVLSSVVATAQDDQFSIAAEFRVRPEFRGGYRTLATDTSMPAFSVGQRARLMFKYNKDNITFFTSIQDSRVWGDEGIRQDKAALQVNQLWTELDLNKGFSAKIGRQEFVYDDHRLLGNVDWANQTISHDALLFKYENDNGFEWHIAGAFNQSAESIFTTNYPINNYKALGFMWLKKQFDKKHSLSFMAIADAYESASPTSNKLKTSFTAGPFYNYRHKGWKADVAAYYQGGKTKTNLDVNAFMVNAYLQKSLKEFAVGAGIDYISGSDDKTKATESGSFNTLYATNHKFYGYMDYFLNIPTDTKQRGLQDIYAQLGYAPKMSDWSSTVAVHNFSFAHDNNLGFVKINKAIGTEVDFILNYNSSKIIKLQGGYSMMFANNNLELVKGGDASAYQGWAFVMLTVSPTLFQHNVK